MPTTERLEPTKEYIEQMIREHNLETIISLFLAQLPNDLYIKSRSVGHLFLGNNVVDISIQQSNYCDAYCIMSINGSGLMKDLDKYYEVLTKLPNVSCKVHSEQTQYLTGYRLEMYKS